MRTINTKSDVMTAAQSPTDADHTSTAAAERERQARHAALTAPLPTQAMSPDAPPGYPYHPSANLLPLMTGAEFDELTADIKANGQRESIKRFEGEVIDGRNRLRACIVAGVAPRFEDIEITGSPAEYVISLNIRRRHLTAGQRAAVAVEVADQLAIEARRRRARAGTSRKVGETGGQAPKGWGDRPSPGEKEAGKSTTRAASAAGAGVTATKALVRVRRERPDVFERVKSGELTVAAAARIAKPEAPTAGIKTPTPTTASEVLRLLRSRARDREHLMALMPTVTEIGWCSILADADTFSSAADLDDMARRVATQPSLRARLAKVEAACNEHLCAMRGSRGRDGRAQILALAEEVRMFDIDALLDTGEVEATEQRCANLCKSQKASDRLGA